MIYHHTKQQSTVTPIYSNCTVQQVVDYFRDKPFVQVDTETEGSFNHKNKILLIQFGDRINQFVLNFQELTKEELKLLNNEILNRPTIKKLLQNAKFDLLFFWFHGLNLVNVYDTLIGECLLNAGRYTEKGFYALDSLARRYCNYTLHKEDRGLIHKMGITPRVVKYAAEDVVCLEEIREKQVKELSRIRLMQDDDQDIYTVVGLEMNVLFVFAHMEYEGIKLDTERWKEIEYIVNQDIQEAISRLNDICHEEPRLQKYATIYSDLFSPEGKRSTRVNWNSSKQKLALLKNIFPEIPNTDSRTLTKYKGKHPVIKALISYNKVQKLKSSFSDKLIGHINPNTGRVHTNFWQIVSTGRPSCKKPNMAQIPSRTPTGKKMRKCFVPEKGYDMVGGDYSGAELRIIAEASKDPLWLKIFDEGLDLHSELCAVTFDIPLEDVEKPSHFREDISYRDIQKTIDFG